jgi:uncharacterized membrane protein YkvA (DUF1232 family)
VDLSAMPGNARALFDALLREQALPRDVLAREVNGYAQFVQHKAASHPEVDGASARALADVSLRLLELLNDDLGEDRRRLIQAAIRYFVLEEDAEGDLVSESGFDDDVLVMNATLRVLGLDHLLIAAE